MTGKGKKKIGQQCLEGTRGRGTLNSREEGIGAVHGGSTLYIIPRAESPCCGDPQTSRVDILRRRKGGEYTLLIRRGKISRM